MACANGKITRVYLSSQPRVVNAANWLRNHSYLREVKGQITEVRDLRRVDKGATLSKRSVSFLVTVVDKAGQKNRYSVTEVRSRNSVRAELLAVYVKKGVTGFAGVMGKPGLEERHDGHVHYTPRERSTGRPGYRDDIYGTVESLGLKGTSFAAAKDTRGRA